MHGSSIGHFDKVLSTSPSESQVAISLRAAVAAWTIVGAALDRVLFGPLPGGSFMVIGAALPVAVGYFCGRRYGANRPMLSMLLAQAVTLTTWPFLLMMIMQAFRQVSPEYLTGAIMGFGSFCSLAPLGCASAWIGARRSRAGRRKTRAIV